MPCERCKGFAWVSPGAKTLEACPTQPQRLASLVDEVTEKISWARATQTLRLQTLQASTYVTSAVYISNK
jgi:hypothetical protein